MTDTTTEPPTLEAPTRVIDLLVIGDLNVDLILSGGELPSFGQAEQLVDAATLVLGGSGAIVACGAARLGLAVALVAVVGDDMFGRYALGELERHRVDVRYVIVRSDLSTGCSCVLSVGGERDRATLTHLGAIAKLTTEEVPREAILAARHVHIASPFLQAGLRADLADLLNEAQAAGSRTSLDPNWDPHGRWELDELLPHVDVLFPNATEALMLTGESDVERAAAQLAARGPLVVVKLGAEGALAYDGNRLIRSASPAVDVVDSTGAGDTFDAAYLAATLAGATDVDRLSAAVRAGAISVRGAGGTACQPHRSEIAALDGQDDHEGVGRQRSSSRRGSAMAVELASQPEMWARVRELPQVEYLKLPGKSHKVLGLGAGSSRYMLESWAAGRERRCPGLTTIEVASEFRGGQMPAREYDMVVTLSRSGTSTDTLRALEAVPAGVLRIGLVGVANSPIAAACDQVIALEFADERSVVQTRFATSALAMLRAHEGDDLSPIIQEGSEALNEGLPVRPGDTSNFVFLGTGSSIPLANEAALKLREAAKLHTEAYAVGEYRHGPIACANSRTLVWSLAPVDDSLAAAIAATGATLRSASRDPLAELVSVHRLALAEALHRGLDPDAPEHLERSVILDA